MTTERFFHLTEPSLWQQAKADGTYAWSTRGATLDEVGYLHCSYAHQVEAVAGYVYGDLDGDLVLLEIDSARVPAEIRVEQVDGAPEEFPHIYGPLPVDAVVAVHPLAREDRHWVLPRQISGRPSGR